MPRQMSGTHRIAQIRALTLRKRVFGGSAVVLVLLVMLAFVGMRDLGSIGAGAARVSRDSNQATADTELAFLIGEARARVTQFALSATMDDQKGARDSLSRLAHAIEPGNSDDGGGLDTLATRYINAVDTEMQAIEARRASVEQMQAATAELRTIVSAIVEVLDRETQTAVLRAGGRVGSAFGAADSAASRFAGSRAPAEALTSAAVDSRRLQRFVKGMLEPALRLEQGLRLLVEADEMLRGATSAREAASTAVLEAISERRARAADSQRGAIADMALRVVEARRFSLLTSAAAIGIEILLAVVIGRGIARPIVRLTGVMRQLADGDLGVAIPVPTRHDETGDMARAVTVFRDHMLTERQLAADRAAEQRQALADKRVALRTMADTIEQETGTALASVHERTATMTGAADAMRRPGPGTRRSIRRRPHRRHCPLHGPWQARPNNSRARSAESVTRSASRPRWWRPAVRPARRSRHCRTTWRGSVWLPT